ncbi:NAD(P)-binding protein [Annulohypoxylon maeteangense]|uniref:NAD(P)-binding protein n=1 Tax=Annulohypoxylon maeteangense TaxID=1927788 RepID=UPI002008DDBC|nr:NAD(P)-binding protein [Annulohypoxylon maeteangense]KAI0884360.1 NAD(P)-binding protein [Annulohypoxylon maeteangense]
MSPKETILITGFNGYLAGRVAELALKAGYNVRGTVRNLDAGTEVQKALLKLGYGGGAEVVQIPDMTIPGAFDQAVIGCSAIIHLASPVKDTFILPPPEVVRMNMSGTMGILESASKVGSQLKTVVLMSSAAAIFDVPTEPGVYSEKNWNTTSEPAIAQLGSEAGGLHAYCASKTVGERAFWKFHDEKKPSFSMTTLQATYFIGPSLTPWTSPSQLPFSLGNLFSLLSTKQIPGPNLIYENTIDVRDVARVILWTVLNPVAADGQRYLCAAATGGSQAMADILNKYMPELGLSKGTPGEGYEEDYPSTSGNVAFDGKKAVEATGQEWIPYETSILDTTKALIPLLG